MKMNNFSTIQSQIDYVKYHYLAKIKFKSDIDKLELLKKNKNNWGIDELISNGGVIILNNNKEVLKNGKVNI